MRHVAYIGGPLDGMRGYFQGEPPKTKLLDNPFSPLSPRLPKLVCVYTLTAPGRYEYDGDKEIKRRRKPLSFRPRRDPEMDPAED